MRWFNRFWWILVMLLPILVVAFSLFLQCGHCGKTDEPSDQDPRKATYRDSGFAIR